MDTKASGNKVLQTALSDTNSDGKTGPIIALIKRTGKVYFPVAFCHWFNAAVCTSGGNIY